MLDSAELRRRALGKRLAKALWALPLSPIEPDVSSAPLSEAAEPSGSIRDVRTRLDDLSRSRHPHPPRHHAAAPPPLSRLRHVARVLALRGGDGLRGGGAAAAFARLGDHSRPPRLRFDPPARA